MGARETRGHRIKKPWVQGSAHGIGVCEELVSAS